MGEYGEEGFEEEAAFALNVDGWVKNNWKKKGEGQMERCALCLFGFGFGIVCQSFAGP